MSFNIGDVVEVSAAGGLKAGSGCKAQVVMVKDIFGGVNVLDTSRWWNGNDSTYKDCIKEAVKVQAGASQGLHNNMIMVIFDETDIRWNNQNHGIYFENYFVMSAVQPSTFIPTYDPQSLSQPQQDSNLYCNCGGPTKIVHICGEDVIVCITCKKERLIKPATIPGVFQF